MASRTFLSPTATRALFIHKKGICQFVYNSCKDYCHTSAVTIRDIGILFNRMPMKASMSTVADDNSHDQVALHLHSSITAKIQQNIGTNSLVPDAMNSKVIKTMLASKISDELITNTLIENPALLRYTHSAWTDTISMLKGNGFQPHHILPVVAGFPDLLDVTNHKILLDAMTVLRSLGVPDGKQQLIIFRNPLLLRNSNIHLASKVYNNLLKTFTKSEALAIMCSSPTVLTDDWQNTKNKIYYVYSNMGVRSREITKSRLFSHTFLHLVTRHQFACRTGLYRMPSKREIEAKEDNVKLVDVMPNPTLHEIVDTSDEKFVQNIGNISLSEYHTFVAMMAEEINNHSEDSFLSSDDEDYDSDDSVE